MNETEFKDEICEVLFEMEKIIKEREKKYEYFSKKHQTNNNLTVRDIMYYEMEMEKFTKSLEHNAEKIIQLSLRDKSFLKKIINEKFFEEYQAEIYTFVLEGLALKTSEWKEIIEGEFIKSIEDFKASPEDVDSFLRLLCLEENIPKGLFRIESAYYKKLISELNSQIPCLVYWVTMILWKGKYSNLKTIEAFRKNLLHTDWRIRVITHECLQAWIKEKEVQIKPIRKLSIKDRFFRKFNRNYESNLLAP